MSEQHNKRTEQPKRAHRQWNVGGTVDRARDAVLAACKGAGRWLVRQLRKLPGLLRRLRRRFAGRPSAWRRVKTTAIVVLLLANAVLLAVSLGTSGYARYLAGQKHDQMDTLLGERGVTCGGSVYDSLVNYPQPYAMRMDSAVQDAFAHALLTGDVKAEADKGNATVWTGENGTLRWTASGDVSGEMSLSGQAQPTQLEDAETLVQKLLDKSGIKVRGEHITVSQNTQNAYEVEVTQYIGTTELLGCSLTVTIGENNETTLEGKWCAGETQPMTVRALRTYSPEQMIFQLLEKQSDITQIISVQPVYVLSDRSGGRFTVIPCWRFSADTGDYVLNILTGDVVASADVETTFSTHDVDEDENEDEADDETDADSLTPSDSTTDDTTDDVSGSTDTPAVTAPTDTENPAQDTAGSETPSDAVPTETDSTQDTASDTPAQQDSPWYDDGEVAYETN